MPRLFVALVVPVVLSLAAPAAPVPRNQPGARPLYFPTRVGAKWVYRTGKKEQTEVVTEVRKKDGAYVVAVDRVIEGWSETSPQYTVLVSDQGLVQLEVGLIPEQPPTCLLRATPGARWNTVFGTGPELSITNTTFGPERVKVPAGVYQALRVESRSTLDGQPGLTTSWYAPEVGLVKVLCGDTVTVLKAFTPGKD